MRRGKRIGIGNELKENNIDQVNLLVNQLIQVTKDFFHRDKILQKSTLEVV